MITTEDKDEEAREAARAHFVAPAIQNNIDGWGPCELPDQFKDIPYQPFSKGDRLGKVSKILYVSVILNSYKIYYYTCYYIDRYQIGQVSPSKIKNLQVSFNILIS